jgi:mono/diheme cytochrome c family protein
MKRAGGMLAGALLGALGCGGDAEVAPLPAPVAIPATPQGSGDAAAGYDYLRYGGYVGSGVPLEVFRQFFTGVTLANDLDRTGDNANLPRAFNAFDVTVGGRTVRVAGGTTCFGCHAASLNGRLIPGLGNHASNYTADSSARVRLLDQLVRAMYGAASPEYEAFVPFGRGAQAVGPLSVVPLQGPNGAFLLEDAAASHRDPATLAWRDEPAWTTTAAERFASDVPAWWLLRKKNALYYNGMGRGDFARMLMQVSVVAVRDAAQAAEMLPHFADVAAWIRALEPPRYPDPVDGALAARGEVVFTARCAGCHGTYGAEETYPNLLVPAATVGTDARYAEQFMAPGRLTDWFNRSWYAGGGSSSARMVPTRGYVAPPLDGVWATAPYLHNASVPTLAALLDSRQRPVRWRRDYASDVYDLRAVGWPYTSGTAGDAQTYDTTLPGYRNSGHTYGDALDAAQRGALLEYLKTL